MKEILILWASCSLVGNLLAERSPLIQQATFLSTNFENILTWEHGKEVSPSTIYDVQYKMYGARWQNKSECQNITRLFCNLTRETENYTERYHARVRAVVPNCCVSNWIVSPRFCPKEDTVVGDPEVKYVPSVRSIKFIIQPPYTPLRDQANRTLTVEDIFSRFDVIRYQIIIFCQKTLQKWKKTESNKEFEISELDPDTEYNGTIHIRYSEKVSKPHTFRVRTLPDNRWLTYLFGVIAFIVLLIFGTIYYLIYKYVKRYTTQQPISLRYKGKGKSLQGKRVEETFFGTKASNSEKLMHIMDFKDVSHFRPLMLTAEHILMPCDLAKPFQIDPETKPEQINQHLQEVLEQQMEFDLPDRVYQQQAKMTSIQCVAAPLGQTDGTGPIGYAPQAIQNSAPHTPEDKRSTLTYGVCIEGTSRINKTSSSPNQTTKSGSVSEGFIGNGPTKAEKQKQDKGGLWGNLDQKEPMLEPEKADKTQQLLLREDAQGRSQPFSSLLQERGPAHLGERTGRYQQQPVGFLPSAVAVGQMAPSEVESPLSAIPNSLFSVCVSDNFSRDPSLLGQRAAWDSFAWPNSRWPPSSFQVTDCISPASEGLKSEPEPLMGPPESSDSPHDNSLPPDLFRALELKLQWDHGPEENAAC